MKTATAKTTTGVTRINLKKVLYLTDFSEPSEAALPFAAAVAREYGAKVYALHVMTPSPLAYTTPESIVPVMEAEEEVARVEMQRADAHLAGIVHEIIVENGVSVWPAVERAIKQLGIELIVVGTHGRSGAERLLLGSVAEEIFRRSSVPVLTIGPWAARAVHNAAKFHRILFATDFTKESLAAAPYAISMAQENQARLVLLHVIRASRHRGDEKHAEQTIADAMHRLLEIIPADAELWCRPEASVQYGTPADTILDLARDRGADLIVMGVRDAVGHLGAAVHIQRATAHQVVAHALCPVLTVRG
ncbi:MAG TPA: universal stress protein [Candidatus Acidoferrales bacterium]|jgi:nucleotide-binding universal stress UspA family protein|nr:universal stress protein [Candidatus Acidoferrales bacterium]